jgi:hypothetical protein
MLHISDEDVAEFREIFDLVDTDGSGKISPKELGQLTKKIGLNYTQVGFFFLPPLVKRAPNDHQTQRNKLSKWCGKLM